MSWAEPVRKVVSWALGAARRRKLLPLLVGAIPLGAMACAVSTVGVCLCLWRSGPSYVPGRLFPAVSELGIELPQKRVYQLGFATTGALVSLAILMFEELVAPALLPRACAARAAQAPEELVVGAQVTVRDLQAVPQLNGKKGICESLNVASGRWTVKLSSGEVKALKAENLAASRELKPGESAASEEELLRNMLWWGHAMSAGIAGQGVFVLQTELCAQNFVHWGGAVLFMVGAQNHGKASNELYDRAAARAAGLLSRRGVATVARLRHIILDYSSFVLFAVPLLVQMLPAGETDGSAAAKSSGHTAGDGEAKMDFKAMNMMGLMQWGIILQFAVYFLTYGCDLVAAASAPPPQREEAVEGHDASETNSARAGSEERGATAASPREKAS